MKKRLTALLLSAVLAAGLLAGCSNGNDNADNTTGNTQSSSDTQGSGESKAASGDKTELEFFVQKREAADTFQKIVDEFNKEHDDIEVKLNIVPDSSSILMSRAATSDLPDIMQVGGMQDADTIQFMDEGHYLDITGEDFLDNVVESYQDSIVYKEKNYVVPISANFSGVYYNKALFAEAGYEIPTTYEELITIAEDIQSRGETPFLFPDKDSWTLVQCWEDNIDGTIRGYRLDTYVAIVNGETTFQDDEKYKESLQKVVDIRQYGQGDTLALGYDQAISDFATGGAYMFMQGIWALPSIKTANPDLELGMFTFPVESGTDQYVSMGIDVNIAIANTCDNPEAAKEFVRFISSPEMVQLYVDNDYSLPCIDGVQANIPEAEAILELVDAGAGALQTIAPPKAFSDERANTIQGLVLTSDATTVEEFLEAMNDVFTANKEEFLEKYGE